MLGLKELLNASKQGGGRILKEQPVLEKDIEFYFREKNQKCQQEHLGGGFQLQWKLGWSSRASAELVPEFGLIALTVYREEQQKDGKLMVLFFGMQTSFIFQGSHQLTNSFPGLKTK